MVSDISCAACSNSARIAETNPKTTYTASENSARLTTSWAHHDRIAGTFGCASSMLKNSDHVDTRDPCSTGWLLCFANFVDWSLLLGRSSSLSSSLSTFILRPSSLSLRRFFCIRLTAALEWWVRRGICPRPGLCGALLKLNIDPIPFPALDGCSGVSSLSAYSGDDIFSAPEEKSTSNFRGVMKEACPNLAFGDGGAGCLWG